MDCNEPYVYEMEGETGYTAVEALLDRLVKEGKVKRNNHEQVGSTEGQSYGGQGGVVSHSHPRAGRCDRIWGEPPGRGLISAAAEMMQQEAGVRGSAIEGNQGSGTRCE